MDIAAINALVASLKTAADVAKALVDLKLTGEVHAKVAELQTALLAAQSSALSATSAQFQLQERVRELESRLKEAHDWSATKLRYALVSPWRGAAQVYALKRSEAHGEAPHLLCTNCFNAGKPVILNPARLGNRTIMVCPACKASLEAGYSGVGPAKYAEDYLQPAPAPDASG